MLDQMGFLTDPKTWPNHKGAIEITLLIFVRFKHHSLQQKLVLQHSLSKYIDEQTRIGLAVLISLVTLITVVVHKAYPKGINWLTEFTKYFKTWPKPALFWWTHENLANCKRSTLKIWQVAKYIEFKIWCLFQNMTCCKAFNSKFDACLKTWFKICHVVSFLFKKLAFV